MAAKNKSPFASKKMLEARGSALQVQSFAGLPYCLEALRKRLQKGAAKRRPIRCALQKKM